MEEIRTERVCVRAGWIAWVPEMQDLQYTTALTVHFMPSCANDPRRAEARAVEVQAALAAVEFIRRLREFIRRNAERYARQWPQLRRSDGTLRGFDPEELQRVFVPYDNRGRRGKLALTRALARMAEQGGANE